VNVGLRNWLAERCLEAIATERPDRSLIALAAFVERADRSGAAVGLGEEAIRLLGSEPKIFERAGGEVRLLETLVGDLPEMRWRAPRFIDAVSACRRCCGAPPRAVAREAGGRSDGMPPSLEELAWTVCAAAALFNTGLFFEVHELLEPCWMRAERPLKTFLQGLIQIAAGLHHEQNGNRRGAVALVGDGCGKLRPFAPGAFGVELAEFLAEMSKLSRALAAAEAAFEIRIPRLVVGDVDRERQR
jgi:predicted metal-dependent hydrolase